MWTRDVPKSDGYYWARASINWRKTTEYSDAEVVQLSTWGDIRSVSAIGTDEDMNPRAFLWYDDALRFAPPPFTTDDAVRLGVT